MWAAWMLSVTAVLSWRVSDRALGISSAAAPIGRLAARPTAHFGMRARSAGERRVSNVGSRVDWSCAVAACVRGRADPVALLQPRRRRQGGADGGAVGRGKEMGSGDRGGSLTRHPPAPHTPYSTFMDTVCARYDAFVGYAAPSSLVGVQHGTRLLLLFIHIQTQHSS